MFVHTKKNKNDDVDVDDGDEFYSSSVSNTINQIRLMGKRD